MTKNKILTTLNQALKVAILSLLDSGGNPELRDVLEGVPLGTADNTSNGELGTKVIVIAERSGNEALNSGMPYNARNQHFTNDTAGPTQIVYTDAADVTVATRVISYVDSTTANSPVTNIADTLA